jgi:hypothetical protein
VQILQNPFVDPTMFCLALPLTTLVVLRATHRVEDTWLIQSYGRATSLVTGHVVSRFATIPVIPGILLCTLFGHSRCGERWSQQQKLQAYRVQECTKTIYCRTIITSSINSISSAVSRDGLIVSHAIQVLVLHGM